MKKVLISYDLSGYEKPLELTRKIYGYIDSSNHGKYKYHRSGILSNIEFDKISKGAFMIDPKDKEKVIKGFKEINLKIRVLDININN